MMQKHDLIVNNYKKSSLLADTHIISNKNRNFFIYLEVLCKHSFSTLFHISCFILFFSFCFEFVSVVLMPPALLHRTFVYIAHLLFFSFCKILLIHSHFMRVHKIVSFFLFFFLFLYSVSFTFSLAKLNDIGYII